MLESLLRSWLRFPYSSPRPLYERENAQFSPIQDLSLVCHQVCDSGEKSLMAKAGSVGSCPQPSNKKPVLPAPNFLVLFHFSALFWALKTVSRFTPTSQSPSFLPIDNPFYVCEYFSHKFPAFSRRWVPRGLDNAEDL